MVVYDLVYRINEINTNIFESIVNNYNEGTHDYDFSCEMLSKFRCNAIKLSKRIDDGNNFLKSIDDAYNKHREYIDIIKEKRSI